jgi:glycosyltransferase involved in cell wall biosynthesis
VAAAPDKPPPASLLRVVVPDVYLLTWVPGAARAARAIVRERSIDCVITTSPYESTHLAALALGARRPAWIADFRDGWTFESWRPPFPTPMQRGLDRRLERRVVRTADRVVAAHLPLVEDFRTRLGVEAAHVPNGWDPDLDSELAQARPPSVEPGRTTLVYTGKLSGGWGRDPGALFDALKLVLRDDPGMRDRLALVLAGRLDRDEESLLEGLELDGVVRHVGHLSRAEAAALQREADALLLLTSRELSWEAPGKLFEYLAAGRPILALASGNEAARIVNETGTGVTVPPDDVEAIAGALRDAVRGELTRAYAPRDLDAYVYPAPAEAVAEQIELAIERRAGR